MTTQNDGILDYMINVGPITPIVALDEFGCMRLPARIGEIKETIKDTGLVIKDEWVEHVNRNGIKKRFKAYWVEKAS